MKNQELKLYEMSINFNEITIECKATGKREAREKCLKKLSKKNIKSLIDKRNTFLDVSWKN